MSKTLLGKINSGEEIYKFTLSNGKVSLSVIEYGASIQSLTFLGKEMVLGYDKLDDYEKYTDCFGAIVGRYANRIENGSFSLGVKNYNLYKNDGNNTLHGGKIGYHRVKWTGREEDGKIVMQYLSKDGEEGFPGNLSVTVVYHLCDDGIGIEYIAKSDKDTVVNLSNHAYFNLSGGIDSIEHHYLTLDADRFTPVKEGLIPTGELRLVEGTSFDFRKPKLIGRDINFDDEQLKMAGGYDHNFVINGSGFRRFAEVYSHITDISMDCYTDMPGVQVYSGNFLNDRKIKGDGEIRKRYGLCLETQYFPNSVNIPSFPSTVLKAGETYKSKTDYRFKFKD